MDLMIGCQCGAHFRTEKKHVGATATCPKCGTTIEIAPEPTDIQTGPANGLLGTDETPPPLPTRSEQLPASSEYDSDESPPPLPGGNEKKNIAEPKREGSHFVNFVIYFLCLAALVFIGLMIYAIWPEITGREVASEMKDANGQAEKNEGQQEPTAESSTQPSASQGDPRLESHSKDQESSENRSKPTPATRATVDPLKDSADPLSTARSAMEANDFARVLEILENADAGLQATDEVQMLIKSAKFASHVKQGQKLLAAGDASDAVAEFSSALQLQPTNETAMALIHEAMRSAGFRSTPLIETFSTVPDGELPDGWQSDNSVVVKHRGGSSWIESSADGEHILTSPLLAFPEDFELRIAAQLDDRTKVNIALLNERAGVLKQVGVKCEYSGQIRAGFDNAFVIQPGRVHGTVPIRLVRDGRILRLFVRDQETTRPIDVSSHDVRKVAITIQGGQRSSRIVEFSMLQHYKDLAVASPSSLAESFDVVKVGELPAKWAGTNAVGVKRVDGNSWIEADASGYHEVATQPIRFPDDFELQMMVGLPDSTLEVSLIGAGNTPDLVITLTGDEHYQGGDVTAQYTGTIAKELRVQTVETIPVRLVREGDTFRLSFGGVENVLSDRKPRFRDFTHIAFRWQVDRAPVRIHAVSVQRLSISPSPVVSKEADKADDRKSLNGKWQVEGKEKEVYQMTEERGQLVVAYRQFGRNYTGTLERTSEPRWEVWAGPASGQMLIIRRLEPNRLYVIKTWSGIKDRFYLVREAPPDSAPELDTSAEKSSGETTDGAGKDAIQSLSGTWRGSLVGRVWTLTEREDRVTLKTGRTGDLVQGEGVVLRTPKERWDSWKGTLTVTFVEDRHGIPRTLGFTIRKLDDNKLYVTEDKIIWNVKNGNETNRAKAADRYYLLKEADPLGIP